MTKKELARRMLEEYFNYVYTMNVHQKPTKGINSGAEGRALERAINYTFNLLSRCNVVQGAGVYDCIKYGTIDGKRKRISIEIKSGCGTIATLDEKGQILTSPLMKSNFVCYCPRFYPDMDITKQVFFFDTQDFMNVLKKNNLIRLKCSGNMQKIKKSGGEWYYDIMSIQSFTNSKKKYESFMNDLFFNGMTFGDFIDWYEITTN